MSTTPQDDRPHVQCDICRSAGLVEVFHPTWQPDRDPYYLDGDGRPIVTRLAAHCACQLGQWMRERTSQEMQRRIPWLRDILEGRSRTAWQLDKPGMFDDGSEWARYQRSGQSPTEFVRARIAALVTRPPAPSRRTPEDVAAQLRARREQQQEAAA